MEYPSHTKSNRFSAGLSCFRLNLSLRTDAIGGGSQERIGRFYCETRRNMLISAIEINSTNPRLLKLKKKEKCLVMTKVAIVAYIPRSASSDTTSHHLVIGQFC